jgi:hypothetical protein
MALGACIPALLSACLRARFTTTACGGFVKLSYLLTLDGDWRGRASGDGAIEERDVLITEMVNFQIENGKARIEPAQAGILAWLNTDPVSFFQGKDRQVAGGKTARNN